MLGMLGMLVGASMIFSMPWAFPACGQTQTFDARGFRSTVASHFCYLTISSLLYGMFRDPEYRLYITILFVATTIITISFLYHGVFKTVAVAMRHTTFNVASIMTTTGFGTEDFTRWAQLIRLAVSLVPRFPSDLPS